MSKSTMTALFAVVVVAVMTAGMLGCRRASHSQMEAERFRDSIVAEMHHAFPGRTVNIVDGDPSAIVVGDCRLGLNNALRTYDLSGRNPQLLKQLAADLMTLATSGNKSQFLKSFAEAQDHLLPQIPPAAVTRDAGSVRIPVAGNLFVAIVADSERSYGYLTTNVLQHWGKSQEEVLALAMRNLDARSKGTQFRLFTKGDTTFIAVGGVGDGYDAARILLPGFKKVIGAKLGFPFRFGIPNREFLICWSAVDSAESQAMARKRIKADYESRPYPLSPSVFQVAADGSISEQSDDQPYPGGYMIPPAKQ